jgi:K(+)-stimulated pyrophosphate-energized sodium pump
MNILIKLMSIVSLVIAPTLAHNFAGKIKMEREQKIQNLINIDKASVAENGERTNDQWTLITPPGSDRAAAEKQVQSFISVLEDDHMINNSTFSVAVAKGELYINGDKQPSSVQQKYSEYIHRTGDFISKEVPMK